MWTGLFPQQLLRQVFGVSSLPQTVFTSFNAALSWLFGEHDIEKRTIVNEIGLSAVVSETRF